MLILLSLAPRYINRISRKAMGETLNEEDVSELLVGGADPCEVTQETGNGSATLSGDVRDRRRPNIDVEIEMT